MRGRVLLGWMMALVLLAALGACGKGGAASKDPAAAVGKVTAVAGEVTVTRPGATASAAAPVEVGLVVTRDMTFTTGVGASLEVKFDNNYTWKLAEGRERAIAKLRVVDLPRAESGQTVDDGLADNEADRTTGAGRHAEQAAAESASTVQRPAAESAAAPPPAPDPMAAPIEPPATDTDGEDGTGGHMALEEGKMGKKGGGRPRGGAPKHADGPPPDLQPPAPPPPPGGGGGGSKGGGGGSGSDSIDEVLGGGGGGPKSASPPSPDASGVPDRPSVTSIKEAMAPIVVDIKKCWDQYKVDGTLKVKVTFNASGKVIDVAILEPFGGTPTGACAEKAVRAGKFPRSQAPTTTISYPVKLGP